MSFARIASGLASDLIGRRSRRLVSDMGRPLSTK